MFLGGGVALFFSMGVHVYAFSQTNLVYNGDFEIGTPPTGHGQIDRAAGWSNAGGFVSTGGVFVWPSPDLLDALSTDPDFGVPTSKWHTNLPDFKATAGNRRYAFISNVLLNGVENSAEKITGTLVSALPQGCYTFEIKAARPNLNTSGVQPTRNFLIITLKSSHPNTPPKVIMDLSNNGSQFSVQQHNWVAQGSSFDISASEAGKYDSIMVAMGTSLFGCNSGSISHCSRNSHALVDEIAIYSKLEVGVNLPDQIRVCLGTELVLTPTIQRFGLTSTNPNFSWTKNPLPWNHYQAPFWDAQYTLRDYPLQNTTYTFSGTDNGCGAQKTVQVIVEDLKEAQISGSFTECDLDGSQRYTLLNNIAGVDVSWSIIGGTAILPPLVNPHYLDVTWNSGSGLKYVVVTQNSWTCSRTDTLFIKECCFWEGPIVDPDPESIILRAHNKKHSDIFSGNYVTSADVAYLEINGTYEIDRQAYYSGVTFIMGPGAKIVLTHNLADFDECIFQACGNEMWSGIYTTYSHLYMSNCVISESENGVHASGESILFIDQCEFKQNYIALQYFDRYLTVQTNLMSAINVSNSIFKGNEGQLLLRPYNQWITEDGLMVPRNSFCGINVFNSKLVNIGQFNNSSNVNVFLGLENGIMTRFSEVNVYHAVFTNIKSVEPHNIYSSPLHRGIGILHNNLNTPYFSRDDKRPVVHACTFNQCNTGVYGIFTDTLSVEYCTFNQVTEGIHIVNDLGTAGIRYNAIDAVGILAKAVSLEHTFASSLTSNKAHVHNNYISTTALGIDITGQRINVEDNIIHLKYTHPTRVVTGIRARNLTKPYPHGFSSSNNILRNEITLVQGPIPQAHVEGFPNILRWNRGIAVEHSSFITVADNVIDNTAAAMVLEGNLLVEVAINCNTYRDNYVGLFRLNSDVTVQGASGQPADNRWIRIKGQNGRIWEPQSIGFNTQLVYFHRDLTFPSNNAPNWFSPAPYTGDVLPVENHNQFSRCNSFSQNGDEEAGEHDYYDLEGLKHIAENNVDYSGLQADLGIYQAHYAESGLMQALVSDSSLLANEIFNDFYNLHQTALIAALPAAYTALLLGDLDGYADYLDRVSNASMNAFDSLGLVVSEIYARSWALPSQKAMILDSADYQRLYHIAHMDYVAGGSAIYTARVMLGIDPHFTMNFRQEHGNKLRFADANDLITFPNPAQNYVNFNLVDIGNVSFEFVIYDVNGRKMSSGMLDVQDGYGRVNLHELNNGMYFIQLTSAERSYRTKIMVLKP